MKLESESSMATTEVKEEQEVYVWLPPDYDKGKHILSFALSHFPNGGTKIIPFTIIPVKHTNVLHHSVDHIVNQYDVPLNHRRKTCIETLDKHVAQCAIKEFKAERLILRNDSQQNGILELIKSKRIKNLVMEFSPNSKILELVKASANPLCKIRFVQKGHPIITRCPRLDLPEATSEEKNKYISGSSFSQISETSMATTEVKEDQKVYALLPWNNYDEGKCTLSWTLSHFSKDETKFFATFIIPPLSRQNGLIHQKSLICYESLQKHVAQCGTQKFKVEKLIHKKDDVVEGILELINLNGIKNLVMGFSPNSELVKERANPLCKIWFIQNGNLISTHEREMEFLLLKELQKIRKENNRLEKENQQLILDNLNLRSQQDDDVTRLEEFRKLIAAMSCQFSPSELDQATENYLDSSKIGEGGFACVYKGNLRGFTVAIKKLKLESLQGLSGLEQEVGILTSVRHPNIINLIGSCSEISALVYEFMPNESLEKCLANKPSSLTWNIRIRIIIEICLGLVFLHSNKPHLVIHGDLKPDNILLDANFHSKLSDFGISKIIKQPDTNTTAVYHTIHPAGTFGYIDPEFGTTGELTTKSDVYAFGIIMLRLLTRKPALNIASEVQKAIKTSKLLSIVDQDAGWPPIVANKLAKLGLSCVAMLRKNRPDINEVRALIETLGEGSLGEGCFVIEGVGIF